MGSNPTGRANNSTSNLMKAKIEAKLSNPKFIDPGSIGYATEGSAAMDLRACVYEAVTIHPGEVKILGTGLAINMQGHSMVAIVASRSGLAFKHQVYIPQGIGVIDSDFQGEIKVNLINSGKEPYTIQPGERIAQLMFQPVIQVGFNFVNEFSSPTQRGEGGFGSTGKS